MPRLHGLRRMARHTFNRRSRDAKIRGMLITTGKVNNGVIQIDTNDLPNGTTVTVLAHEGDETFELDATREAELLAAIAEADRGELISSSELLQNIRHS